MLVLTEVGGQTISQESCQQLYLKPSSIGIRILKSSEPQKVLTGTIKISNSMHVPKDQNDQNMNTLKGLKVLQNFLSKMFNF